MAVIGDAAVMIHTGDVSHLSEDSRFDMASRIIGGAGLDTHSIPGEHDVLVDDGHGASPRSASAAGTASTRPGATSSA